MASLLNPYLNFNGDARQAFEFYAQVFGGKPNLSTFGQFGHAEGPDADRIMHAVLATDAGYTLMGADVTGDMEYHPVAGMTISISGDDGDTLREYFAKLAEDGTVTMPLEKQVWGDEFGMCVDRFGVPWMVNVNSQQA